MIKQLLLVLLIAVVLAQDVCPSKLVVQCEQDLQLAYQQCDKAAKQKGADQTADINCIRYLLSGKKDCWPCICQVAKKAGWKVKGCDLLLNFIRNFDEVAKKYQDDKITNLLQV